MIADVYYDFKARLKQQGIILSYCGYVSENVLFALGDTLKKHMNLEDADRNVAKRLFSVFVEQVQNIIRYSAERAPVDSSRAEGMGSGIVMIGSEDDAFFVTCANLIGNDDVSHLKGRLSYLNRLDQEGLKTYYKRMLKEPAAADDLGGSVGLIEIARRASRPMEFDFKKIDSSRTFFCLKVFI